MANSNNQTEGLSEDIKNSALPGKKPEVILKAIFNSNSMTELNPQSLNTSLDNTLLLDKTNAFFLPFYEFFFYPGNELGLIAPAYSEGPFYHPFMVVGNEVVLDTSKICLDLGDETICMKVDVIDNEGALTFVDLPAIYRLGEVTAGYDTIGLTFKLLEPPPEVFGRPEAPSPLELPQLIATPIPHEAPIITGLVEIARVEEDDINDQFSQGINEDQSINHQEYSGTLTLSVSLGLNGPPTFGLDPAGLNTLPQLFSKSVLIDYSISGDTFTGHASGHDIFSLKLSSDGSYIFTLYDQIDHASGNGENDYSMDIGALIKVIDIHGNPVNLQSASFIIIIQDDIPARAEDAIPIKGCVEEDGMSFATNDNSEGNKQLFDSNADDEDSGIGVGSLANLFASGTDEPLTFSISSDVSGLPTLYSKGFAVTYNVAGDTLTATADNHTIFTLTVHSDGTWDFDLQDQLDHVDNGLNNENFALRTSANGSTSVANIDFSSIIVATDYDGDSVNALIPGDFTIKVQDDIPIALPYAKIIGVVDEDGVREGAADQGPGDGIAGGIGDVSGEAVIASGTVTSLFQDGADENLTYGFSDNVLTVLQNLGLTSGGEALSYQVVGDTITAYVSAGDVFTFQLTNGGNWTFTLIDQLDHYSGNDENDLKIKLGNIIAATDADGDTVTARAEALKIIVDDDTPIASTTQITGIVDEDGVREGADDQGQGDGIAGGIGDIAGEDVTASGTNLASLFQSGADEPLSFGFASDAITTLNSLGLTSGGNALSYSIAGDTITASAPAGNTIFTFQITDNGNGSGSWNFTLYDQLDHPTGDNENDLVINLGNIIAATDADGDPVTANADQLQITVDDDTPIASTTQITGIVDEDGVREGADDQGQGDGIAGGVGDVAGEVVTVSGTNLATLFQSGADEPLTFGFASNAISTLNGLGLTSGGNALSYSIAGDTITASAPAGNTIFTLQVTDNGNGSGSWNFTLYDQLDHATGNNENDLVLNLGNVIAATDKDGDSVTANANQLQITVDDDSPVNIDPVDAVLANSAEGSATEDLDFTGHIGADEPGSVVFTGTNGSQLTDTDSSPLTSNGQPIYLFGFNTGVLTATTDQTNTDPTKVIFTVTLDPFGTDTYTIDMNGTIDNGAGLTFDDFSGITGGQAEFFPLNSPNVIQDLLITGAVPGTDTINTDNDDIGSNNQFLNNLNGEIIRLDYVTNVAGNQDDIGTLSYTDHYTVNNAGFRVHQLQGSTTTSRAVLVSVYDQAQNPQGNNFIAQGVGDSNERDIITQVIIVSAAMGTSLTFTMDGTQSGYFVDFNADGSVQIGHTDPSVNNDGLLTDDQVFVSTADGFNQMEILNVTDASKGSNSLGIALDNFQLTVIHSGDPVDISLPLQTSDFDGDHAVGTIDFTLLPSQTGDANNNTLTGTDNAEIFYGLGGNDTINAMGGNDIVYGGDGDDTINGGNGNDLLVGGNGNDTLNGDNGNDVLRGGAGNDIINSTLASSAGIDLIDFSDGTSGITFTLDQSPGQHLTSTGGNTAAAGLGTDTYQGIEGVIGTNYSDVIIGSSGNDIIQGNGGNDILTGGNGQDRYVFTPQDTVGTPTVQINGFTTVAGADSDTLDLSKLLKGVTDSTPATDLDDYLHFSQSGGNTTIDVKADGSGTPDMHIQLNAVDLTAGGTQSDSQIIQQLVSNNNLHVG